MKRNDIIRLKNPGTGPERWIVRRGGDEYIFEWGKDYRVSTSCDPENKVASLDYKGSYPLIHKEFARQYKSQFETISED